MTDIIALHMGFINTPYTAETIARPMTAARSESSRKRRRGFSKTMTAEDVSNILEGKYNIVEIFQQIHKDDIEHIVIEGFAKLAAEKLSEDREFTRASLTNLMKPDTKKIEKLFRQFLDQEEMNGMAPGVPTQAAMGGKLHGRGKITRKGRQRPSFIDTGIYRASFRCWAGTK